MLSRAAVMTALVLLAMGTARQTPVRYLALGDSFTIGTGSGADKAFPARVVANLAARGVPAELKNLAVNGYSTQELLDLELPQIGAFKPTVVTLAVGANDIVRSREPEDYRKNLKALFKGLAAQGIRADTIYCLPQPDWSKSPTALAFGEPDQTFDQISLYNEILRQESIAAGAHWVNLFDLMEQQAKDRQLADDGLHPDAKSHQQWADALAKQVPAFSAEALRRKP